MSQQHFPAVKIGNRPQRSIARRLSPLFAVTVSMIMVTSACGKKSSTSEETTSTTTASTVITTSSTVATSSTTPDTAVTPTSIAATKTTSHLTAVTVSAHDNGDRVAFEFDNATPGYSIKSVTSPVAGSDGQKVTISGSTVFLVTFAAASDVELSGGLKTYYNGSKDITPTSAKLITQMKQISDSEGVLTWAIGLSSKAAVSVSTVAGPPQLVFDIA